MGTDFGEKEALLCCIRGLNICTKHARDKRGRNHGVDAHANTNKIASSNSASHSLESYSS